MFSFPSLPPFQGLHPLVAHFPIALLLTAWLPMLLALADKKRRTRWLHTALTLLVLGTISTFAATLTGEATEEIVEHSSQAIEHAIHNHEETAEMARNLFIAVTLLFTVLLILRAKLTNPQNPSKKKPAVMLGGLLVAILYIFGALALANASHQGGMLVHDLGIHAPVGASQPINQPNAQPNTFPADD